MSNIAVQCSVCQGRQTGRLRPCHECGSKFHFPSCGIQPYITVPKQADGESWRDRDLSRLTTNKIVEQPEMARCGVCLGWSEEKINSLRVVGRPLNIAPQTVTDSSVPHTNEKNPNETRREIVVDLREIRRDIVTETSKVRKLEGQLKSAMIKKTKLEERIDQLELSSRKTLSALVATERYLRKPEIEIPRFAVERLRNDLKVDFVRQSQSLNQCKENLAKLMVDIPKVERNLNSATKRLQILQQKQSVRK